MSEPIPESIPTSADPKSKRPVKRRALTPTSQQANQVTALFAKPEREILIPSTDAGDKKPFLPPPPEIVANVQGSSAGAGSGEFHVYKASRRREYERVKMMDYEVAKEKADAEYEIQQAEKKKKDDERTSKNRKKREKLKMRKEKKGEGGQGNVASQDGAVKDPNSTEYGAKGKPVDESLTPEVQTGGVGIVIHDEDG